MCFPIYDLTSVFDPNITCHVYLQAIVDVLHCVFLLQPQPVAPQVGVAMFI